MPAATERIIRWARSHGSATGAAAAVAALVVWAFWRRYTFLAESPYPTGVDGYFYAVELRSLLETGRLYYPASPLALWLMAPLAALTDPITGAKLGAALGTALIAVPVYLLGRRIGGGRGAGLLAATLAVTSVESFYLSTEFVKNGIGLTIAAGFLSALAWALERPNRRRLAVVAALLVAAALTHKMAAALAVLAALPPLVVYVRARPDRDRAWRAALAGGAVLVAAAAALGALAPQRFPAAADLALVADMFSARPDWTLAPLRPSPDFTLHFGYEVAIAGILAIAALAALAVGGRRSGDGRSARALDRAFVIGPALLALGAALPWLDPSDPEGLTYRLRLVAFLPLALCAAGAAGALRRRMSPTVHTALLVGFAAGWFASRPAHFTEGLVRVHPALQTAVRAAAGIVPPDDVIIVPQRQLVFMTTWHTRNHARLRPEPVPPERRWRLLPGKMIHPNLGAAIDAARAEAPAGIQPPHALHPMHRNGLVLMTEATWVWILERLEPDVRAHYQRWVTR